MTNDKDKDNEHDNNKDNDGDCHEDDDGVVAVVVREGAALQEQ